MVSIIDFPDNICYNTHMNNFTLYREEVMAMNEEKTIERKQPQEENVLFGIVGAFLFSLVGGGLYYLLYQIGYIAAISGLIGVICAIKGYSFFSKKESMRGAIISIVIAVLVLVIAWYFCLSNDIYVAYQEWFANGEVDYMPTFFETVRSAYLFLEVVPAYYGDLAISLLLAVVGSASHVIKLFKRLKAEKIEPSVSELE